MVRPRQVTDHQHQSRKDHPVGLRVSHSSILLSRYTGSYATKPTLPQRSLVIFTTDPSHPTARPASSRPHSDILTRLNDSSLLGPSIERGFGAPKANIACSFALVELSTESSSDIAGICGVS